MPREKYDSRKRKISDSEESDEEVNVSSKCILSFGTGDFGQLGLGPDVLEQSEPISLINNEDIIQISCGGMHSAYLTKNGELFTWGCNDDFALGRDTAGDVADSEFTPKKVKSLPNKLKIKKVTTGDSHTAVLTKNGKVFICGNFRNSQGKIGLLEPNEAQKKFSLLFVNPQDPAIDIASGNDHILILTEEGSVFSCGSYEQGQLGRISEKIISYEGGKRGMNLFLNPIIVHFPKIASKTGKRAKVLKITNISCSSFASYAISDEGLVFSWGLNNYAQLGFKSEEEDLNVYFPKHVPFFDTVLSKGNSLMICGGQHHSIFLDQAKNQVYSCGRVDYGRLGLGENLGKEIIDVPQIVTLDNEERPISIACGEVTSFIVTENGNMYSCGMGNCLQLGHETDDDVFEFKKIKIDPLNKVLSAASGAQHSLLLVEKN